MKRVDKTLENIFPQLPQAATNHCKGTIPY